MKKPCMQTNQISSKLFLLLPYKTECPCCNLWRGILLGFVLGTTAWAGMHWLSLLWAVAFFGAIYVFDSLVEDEPFNNNGQEK